MYETILDFQEMLKPIAEDAVSFLEKCIQRAPA